MGQKHRDKSMGQGNGTRKLGKEMGLWDMACGKGPFKITITPCVERVLRHV